MPNEFHVSTSRLTQMLKKGHHNVQLTAEEMKRFNMWIDLNVPFHGTWTETGNVRDGYVDRRMELRKKYGNVDVDIETIDVTNSKPEKFQAPPKAPKRKKQNLKVAGWPMANPKAGKTISVDLGGGEKIELVQIPAGKFVMGSEVGNADEYPTSVVAIDQPFYMQTKEITLAQMQQFMKGYKNGYYDMHYKDQLRPGYNMDADKQFPAIRVSWKMAMDFCKWLSEKTGKKVTLPTEAQWEWAARAGSDNDFFYGDINTDFSKVANLADAQLINYAVKGVDPKPFKNPNQWWDYEPKDKRFDDGTFHLAKVGSYKPNAFGLYDMIGNVAEWTRDTYKPYPYSPSKVEAKGKKVLRGGSWYDRPILARSSYRIE
jgi:formylglycine-generating enzyme required for sulfatase activity